MENANYNYEENLPESVLAEQKAINAIVNFSRLTKKFKSGEYKVEQIRWYFKYGWQIGCIDWKDALIRKVQLIVDGDKQDDGVDFDIEGTEHSFDAKGNRYYPGGRCVIELYRDKGEKLFKPLGINYSPKWHIAHMWASGRNFMFEEARIIEMVNNWRFSDVFKKISGFKIIQANSSPKKFLLLIKPWVLRDILKDKDNSKGYIIGAMN